jgi:hypothetical protein
MLPGGVYFLAAVRGAPRDRPSYDPTRPRVDYLFDDGIEEASERLRGWLNRES